MYALTTVLSAVSALVVSVRAAPMLMAPLAAVQLTGRDVVAPPITSPNASTTWNVGETVTVTWCVVRGMLEVELDVELRAQGYLGPAS